jgi:hypothetical protein
LLVRPIFADTKAAIGEIPSAMPEELAQAIFHCIDAGARVLSVSDAIKHVTHAFGIRPCGGCERRAAALNRWFVFNGRAK